MKTEAHSLNVSPLKQDTQEAPAAGQRIKDSACMNQILDYIIDDSRPI
jgi:hypothetical protein